ncbi:unnamed protein product, partial [Acidithrix sp. C25]
VIGEIIFEIAIEVTVSSEIGSVQAFELENQTVLGGDGSWLTSLREDARKKAIEIGFPAPSEEIWRYSRVEDLTSLSLRVGLSKPIIKLFDGVPPLLDGLKASLVASSSLYLEVAPGSLDIYDRAKNSEVLSVSHISDITKPHWDEYLLMDDFFSAYSLAYSQDHYVISIADNAKIDEPIVISYRVPGEDVAFLPRVVVVLGDGSQANVIEFISSEPSVSFVGANFLSCLGAGSNLYHYQIQDLSKDGYIVANCSARISDHAKLEFGVFSFGGSYARVRAESHLDGADAKAYLKAAYFASGSQMLDFRTLQDHHAPNTFSELLFKGAVSENSHSVYSGLVRIEEGASRSDAFQTNRNLVLSEGARADSVPNLDIRENNVRCSHASAVGPIDPEMVFYLESRGIDPERAKRIIVKGFFNEIMEGIASSEAVEVINELVDIKLRETL